MKTRFLLIATAICLAMGAINPVSATKQTPPTNHGANNQTMPQTSNALHPFPDPAPGLKQFVINLPPLVDENAARVGIIAGRMEPTDGVNTVRISGNVKEKTVQGWGYNYFEVEGANGPTMTTLIGVQPGTPMVTRFLSLPEQLMRYNSRLPLVIYAPENFEIRYRIYTANTEQSANVNAVGTVSKPPVNTSAGNDIVLSVGTHAYLPTGSTASIRLYDSMLMDTNSTYAKVTIPVSKLPVTLAMPKGQSPNPIMGPAVSVSVRDSNGKMLYWNDTTTPINPLGPTVLKMKRTY